MLPPLHLTTNEGFCNPIGFYDANPVFSWKLPVTAGVKSQSAYRIVVASAPGLLPEGADLWDSGKADSDQSVWVSYGGSALQSKQTVFWCVMFWDQDGNASPWSAVASIEAGLLKNADWQAKWISIAEAEVQDTSEKNFQFHRPQYLRKTFDVNGPVAKARLYISAKGLFEARLNGDQVGRDRMTPGWTTYSKRIETLTYDVTESLMEGRNTIGIMVAEGWYSGRISFDRSYTGPRPSPQAISILEIAYDDGKRQTVSSDSSWTGTADGPIRYSDIYDGEDYDAYLEIPGWDRADYDADHWNPVDCAELNPGVSLVPKRHAAVRDMIRIPSIAITRPAPDIAVFDLGQNMVGVAEIHIPVKKNQPVRLRFAEMLEDDGTLYTDNYRTARSADYYTPSADGVIRWKPTFTFHGFRYVELSGYDDNVAEHTDWVTGIVQYSSFDPAGTFTCSHQKLNTLQSNINWGLRGNFLDIPTDCPQRDERLGWTGDAQIFAPTSLLNTDVHAFWASWLQTARDAQFADGGIPNVVPNIRGDEASSGWADAMTVIPWELYLRTGDVRILSENYDGMIKLVGYYQMAPESRVSTFRSYGDWLQPYTRNEEDARRGETPDALVDAAYFARSVQLTMNAARVLGHDQDAAKLEALFKRLQTEFRDTYFDKNAKLTTPVETQTGYLLALAFELVPQDDVAKTVKHLVRTINEADQHLRTGFLGTPLLAPVLSEHQQTGLLYTMLFKETYPSWFYSINQGATTMWERWNSYSHEEGFGDAKMNSFNHYAYGAVGQWFYEGIAGINALEPGYKKILIAPKPDSRLTSARAEHHSPYGLISSSWQTLTKGLSVEVTIPPNTTANIVIPLEDDMNVSVNDEDLATIPDVVLLARNGHSITLQVAPGTFRFITCE